MNYDVYYAIQWVHDGEWDWALEDFWDSEGKLSIITNLKKANMRLKRFQKWKPDLHVRLVELRFKEVVFDED